MAFDFKKLRALMIEKYGSQMDIMIRSSSDGLFILLLEQPFL